MMNQFYISRVILLLLMLPLSVAWAKIPVVDRHPPQSIRMTSHMVALGETIYAIAWRYDLNYQQLAQNNGIEAPYHLRVGQRLSLNKPRISKPAVTK